MAQHVRDGSVLQVLICTRRLMLAGRRHAAQPPRRAVSCTFAHLENKSCAQGRRRSKWRGRANSGGEHLWLSC